MNCEANDLAVVFRGYPQENIGKVVRVISISPIDETCWDYEGELIGRNFFGFLGRANVVADDCLKPLRDKPGEDETLKWAGKPQPKTIKVTSEEEAQRIAETVPGSHVQVFKNRVLVSEYWSDI